MSDKGLQAGVQDVERIRDILFGTQMRDYQQQFEALQRDVVRLQQEIDRLNEQLAEQDNNQGKKLQDLRRDTRQAEDDLRRELRETAQRLAANKVETVDLGRLFLEMGTRLTEGRSVGDLLRSMVEGEQDSAHEG